MNIRHICLINLFSVYKALCRCGD